jgi:hypothetical protein
MEIDFIVSSETRQSSFLFSLKIRKDTMARRGFAHLLAFAAVLAACLAVVHAESEESSNVIKLTNDNYDDVVRVVGFCKWGHGPGQKTICVTCCPLLLTCF